jgi:hypothetical protein
VPIHRTLDQDFFKEWSPNMAYVLGYFAADGSMLKNNRGGYYIEFTSTDRILLEHVQKATGSTHKLTQRMEDARNQPHWKASYRIQIGSKEWFQDLEKLGFTQNKSNTLQFPNVPDEHLAHFVRGYFDGDGCAYFNKLKYADRNNLRWVLVTLFTSGSKSFLEKLHSALRENGIVGGSICDKMRGFELKLSHKDSLALYRLMYHTAEVSELFLPRKREKLEEAIQVLGLDT